MAGSLHRPQYAVTVVPAFQSNTASRATRVVSQHNEVRDLEAWLLTEVCHEVRVEPHLQALSAETPAAPSAITQDGARLDIEASGFWGGRFERTLIDVRVFNPHAPSNRGNQLSSIYCRHENIKKRAYQQRIQETEHASFTPLIFSATGGMAREHSIRGSPRC